MANPPETLSQPPSASPTIPSATPVQPALAIHPSPTPGRLHLLGADAEERRAWAEALGMPAYRARQIGDWVFRRAADGFEQMTDLSKADRLRCAAAADVYTGRVTRTSESSDATVKLLIEWPDGGAAETVWIPEERRHTACVSSQVGCPVGCRFCASGIGGVERNLTTGEIVEQAMRVSRLIVERSAPAAERASVPAQEAASPGSPGSWQPPAERLSNVVLMGMGEPLANYDAVLRAIRIMNSPDGLGIGARKITLSTVGLPAQIRRLAAEGLQINLALSLHAPDDALRHELIPWGKGVKIADLVEACQFYFAQTRREVTLEYVLLAGVNDRPRHADALAAIARRLRCNVNLLRYNPVPGLPFERPDSQSAMSFQTRLRSAGVNAHLRRSRGSDVAAACGQLRRSSGLDTAHRHSERSEESSQE